MQESFEIRFPEKRDYEELKKLWKTSFDDTDEALCFFFENTASPNRALAVFCDGVPVSALYMLESEILIDNELYSAYYIYAVCTNPAYRNKGLMKTLFGRVDEICKERGIDYAFLVPEEKYLFDVYEKLGFTTGFFYEERCFENPFQYSDFEESPLTFDKYRKLLLGEGTTFPRVILEESTYKSFFNSVSGDVKSVFSESTGFALFETAEEEVTVYELSGNEDELINAVFKNSEVKKLTCRFPAKENGIPYGMYKKIGDVPDIEKGFFGIPYAT